MYLLLSLLIFLIINIVLNVIIMRKNKLLSKIWKVIKLKKSGFIIFTTYSILMNVVMYIEKVHIEFIKVNHLEINEVPIIIMMVVIVEVFAYMIGFAFQIMEDVMRAKFVKDEKINIIIITVLILPIIIIIFLYYFISDIESYPAKYRGFIGIITMLLPFWNVIFIVHGINKCIFDSEIYYKNDLKQKIKVISIWFLVIWINMSMAVYVNKLIVSDKIINSTVGLKDSLYFSIITLTTIGYGDILPENGYLKLVVIVFSLVNYYLIIIGIGNIIGNNSNKKSVRTKINLSNKRTRKNMRTKYCKIRREKLVGNDMVKGER